LAELVGSGAIFFDVDVNPAVLGVTTSAMLWMSVAPAHLDAVATSLAEHEELASSPRPRARPTSSHTRSPLIRPRFTIT
jgi:hypothetical protein